VGGDPNQVITKAEIKATVPKSLLTCLGNPKIPDKITSREVSTYILSLNKAHADCFNKLGSVRKLLTK
jgi:hypothetical protein